MRRRRTACWALMLLHDSRRQARFHGDDLILLAIQDRSLWNGAEIAEGRRILSRARILAREGSGQYVIQAAIAALHTAAPVDWPEIAPCENSTICMPHVALLRRAGRTLEARIAYQRALTLVHNDAERRLLERRLAELA
jgi:RNA polymerase sigma-70 factor, ECF subfamily